MGIFFILFVCSALLLLYFILNEKRVKSYYESKGIPYLGNGTISFVTDNIQGIGFVEKFTIQYRAMKKKNVKVAMGVDFGKEGLMLLDPELIKQALVKDFDHFTDRRIFAVPDKDYLFKRMLIALTGDKWKDLRSKLSPTFTTGKIKRLFSLFDQSAKKLVKFVEAEMKASPEGEMDLSNGYSKMTMDVIASAACGMNSQAFDQKDPSLFEQMGKKLQLRLGGSIKTVFFLLLLFISPKLSDAMGFTFFDLEMQDFFSKAIKGSIEDRKKKGERRNDFIQLMLESREGKLKTEEEELEAFEKEALLKEKKDSSGDATNTLDDEGIVANAVLFILAGFDTTQSLLLFIAYALALNQDVQEKLREEVRKTLDENDGEFTYDSVQKMSYLEMVINETLRIYSPAGVTDRTATMDWKVPGTDFVLKKGQGIVVSIAGLHSDPEYFPNPEKFDPERFSPENKGKISPYVYLPFGQGPRNCIGMRFALIEVKLAVSHLVHNFKIEPSKNTTIPMKFANSNSLQPAEGMFLSLNKIQN